NPGAVTLVSGSGMNDTIVTFTGSQAAVNQALDGTSFIGNLNFVGAATLTLATSDQGNTPTPAKIDTDVIAITVTAVNDPPVNNVPAPQNMNENTSLVFQVSNGNPVTVADVDATVEQVTLSAVNGLVSLMTKTG